MRTIELHLCCTWTGAGSTRQRFEICEPKGVYRRGVDEEPNDTPTIELNRTTEMSSDGYVPMQGPRTLGTARRLIQGIETVQMLRKGQILGAKRANWTTTAIAFALLFGLN